MSTPEINQVLAQMRVARAQAMGAAPAIEPSSQSDFGEVLKRSIDAVNDTQQQANSMRTAFERGEDGPDLAEVMIAAQKSSIAFQAMVEVRNKLVDAYKDVMNMPV
ncbi:MAG: flagellar hook-basal body complex protein FliE [Chromatiaceae bacterium]|jgi:flagellar hook-basal body complex protein FliE|nr:flagellar hook-basal body complex protein FliE [Chromatiaceae bacterium]